MTTHLDSQTGSRGTHGLRWLHYTKHLKRKQVCYKGKAISRDVVLLPAFKPSCLEASPVTPTALEVMRDRLRLGMPLVFPLQLCGQGWPFSGPACKGSTFYPAGSKTSQFVGSAVREHGTLSDSVPNKVVRSWVSVVLASRNHRFPKHPPHCVTGPLPDGLWATEEVDEELAPPESLWLVLPLPLGLPLADGEGDDRDGELCWFMHWATAKPVRQVKGDVTKQEETSRPGGRGPNCVSDPLGQAPTCVKATLTNSNPAP